MNRFSMLLGALAVSVAIAACDNKPVENKSIATVSEPTAAPRSAPAAGVAYKIGPSDSKVEFVGAKVTGKHEGSFDAFTGTVTIPGGDPLKGAVTVEIDAASLKTDNAKLSGHLKSPDFFDVAKYPKARFTSTSVKAGGDKGAGYTISGNLELHGVTKGISFPANIKMAGDKVEVDAEFGINRKDFSLVYPGMPDDLIKDEVLIKLTVRAPKNS